MTKYYLIIHFFDYTLLLILVSTSFQESKIGYINKHSFLNQLKDEKTNTSQFFCRAD